MTMFGENEQKWNQLYGLSKTVVLKFYWKINGPDKSLTDVMQQYSFYH